MIQHDAMGCRVSVKIDAKSKSPIKKDMHSKEKATNVTIDPRNDEMLSSPDPDSSEYDFTMTSPDGVLLDKKGIRI